MEIRIQIRGRVFSICFGHETRWFEQTYLISIAQEWYDENKQVYYGKMLWNL